MVILGIDKLFKTMNRPGPNWPNSTQPNHNAFGQIHSFWRSVNQLISLPFIYKFIQFMCATFGTCFKYLTLLVFILSGTHKSGNWKNIKNFVCFNRIPER